VELRVTESDILVCYLFVRMVKYVFVCFLEFVSWVELEWSLMRGCI
jgi:hypothetical protein